MMPNGAIVHKVAMKVPEDKDGKKKSKSKKATPAKKTEPLKFDTLSSFERWVNNKQKEYQANLKDKITPYQFYLTQGVGFERPFTGEYWETLDVGVYSCACCTQRLFMSDHKFQVPTGHATFWNHIVDSVDFTEDKLKQPKVTNAHVDTLYKNKTPIKRCICSNVSI